MFLYSCLFALVYVCGALGIGFLMARLAANRPQLGGNLGHLLAFLGAVIAGVLFVRRERRLFTASEQRRIVAYCFAWLVLFEALSLLSAIGKLRQLPAWVLIGILGVTLLVDGAIVWGSFSYVVRKVMSKRVAAPSDVV